MAKVIVIEDTPTVRDIITIILEMNGFDVIVAADGEQGIERICSQLPELVVTDIKMPRVDGIEMIRKLRQIPQHRNLPILVVTGLGMEKGMEAIRAGANRVMTHPVEDKMLLNTVMDLLSTDRLRTHPTTEL
jgi:CheY-like chemotaxis protein